jgi:hypothetical protein
MNRININEDADIIIDYVHKVQRDTPVCKHAIITGKHPGNPKFWSIESIPKALIAADSEGGQCGSITCLDCILETAKQYSL